MTERTTHREAQREAPAAAGLSLSWEAAAALSKEVHDLRADVAALTLRNETLVASLGDLNAVALRLRADVTRLEGELESLTLSAKATYDAYKTAEGQRDTLRTALEEIRRAEEILETLAESEEDKRDWLLRIEEREMSLKLARAALGVPK